MKGNKTSLPGVVQVPPPAARQRGAARGGAAAAVGGAGPAPDRPQRDHDAARGGLRRPLPGKLTDLGRRLVIRIGSENGPTPDKAQEGYDSARSEIWRPLPGKTTVHSRNFVVEPAK